MKYQEKFELSADNANYFGAMFDIFISGGIHGNSNNRSTQAKLLVEPWFTGFFLLLDFDERSQKFSYKVTDHSGKEIGGCYDQELVPGMKMLFRLISTYTKKDMSECNVSIDISSVNHVFIFLLTKILLREYRPLNLFAVYTEPVSYQRNVNSSNESEEYYLYDEILGLSYTIPGFSRRRRLPNDILIATLGFERQRVLAAWSEIDPEGGFIPIVGFPPFRPGWNITSITMNYKVIEESAAEQKIETCDSSSPFAIYELLKAINDQYMERYNILIAPFGTRPHCLGASLFAVDHPHCHVIYDYPIQKGFRSEDASRTHLYVLTRFLNS